MRNQVSSVLPNALVSRIAISGLMPDLPVMTLLSACRVTPRIFAPSEIDNPKGSRQALRMLRPGCGGFFMGMCGFSFALVVVDQFNVKSIFPVKTENDAPSLLIQPRRRPRSHRCPLPQL